MRLALSILLLPLLSFAADIIPDERRIVWQDRVGVPGGIPNYTTNWCNVKVSIPGTALVAVGDGVTDDTAALQFALDNCPFNGGLVVYMPAGRYRITSMLYMRYGNRMALRGAGMGQTVIVCENTYGIAVQRSTDGPWTLPLLSGYERGSTNLVTVTNAPAGAHLVAGTFCAIRQTNDGVFVATGTEGIHTDRALGQMFQIHAVNNETNLTIWPPLFWGYTNDMGPSITWYFASWAPGTNHIQYAGIESLTLTNTALNIDLVTFERASWCWMKDVEIYRPSRNAVQMQYAYGNEIRDSYIHHSFSAPEGGGTGYGIDLMWYSTANLIENNIFNLIRTPIVVGVGSAGNVFGYNYNAGQSNDTTTVLMPDLSLHSAHPMFNLFEGNVMLKAMADFFHGSSSHNTFHRNSIRTQTDATTSANWGMEIDATNLYYNVVGNVFGFTNMVGVYQSPDPKDYAAEYIYTLGYLSSGGGEVVDPRVESTLLRQMNFDYVNNAVVVDGTSTSNLVDSLYLASKPTWFSNATYPPVVSTGPTVAQIPAQLRFLGVDYSGAQSTNAVIRTTVLRVGTLRGR